MIQVQKHRYDLHKTRHVEYERSAHHHKAIKRSSRSPCDDVEEHQARYNTQLGKRHWRTQDWASRAGKNAIYSNGASWDRIWDDIYTRMEFTKVEQDASIRSKNCTRIDSLV